MKEVIVFVPPPSYLHAYFCTFPADERGANPEIACMLLLQQVKEAFKQTGSVKVKSVKLILTGI